MIALIAFVITFCLGFLAGVWSMSVRMKHNHLAKQIAMFRLMSECYEKTKQPGPAQKEPKVN